MTNHPAVIEAATRAINDQLVIIRSDLDGAQDIPDTLAALQRIAWTVADLMNYARRHGARASAVTLEALIERERYGIGGL